MAYPARTPQLAFDLGPQPDPATAPQPPELILSGPHQGQWEVRRPGLGGERFADGERAAVRHRWLLSLWKALTYYEEVNGDLYDKRTGKRLRTGYRQVFYSICDGHQLRATLRAVEASPRGYAFTFHTDFGSALCAACVRQHLRDVLHAIRCVDLSGWLVAGCEPLGRDCDHLAHCDECYAPFWHAEDWP